MTDRLLACGAFGALLLFAPCLIRPALAEGLTLKYHLALKFTSETQAPAPQASQSEEDYAVTLFPHSFEVHDNALIRVYDFSGRHVTIADENKKTVSSFPLYAIPVANRQKRDALLRQKQAGSASINDVDVDMALGADSDASTAGQVQTAFAQGKTVFTAAGRQLAAFSVSDKAVPPELQASYMHFLVYETTLHPLIRRQLASSEKIFSSLSYTSHESGTRTDVSLTLKSAEKSPASAPDAFTGLAPVFGGDAKLDAAILRSQGPGPTQSAQELKIAGFLEKKDNLRAVLAAAELSLTFGPDALQNSTVAQKALEAGRADPVAGPTLAAINNPPRSSDEFKKAMIQMNAAEKAAPDDSYLIELYRGNLMRAVLEKPGRKPSADETKALQQAMQKIADAIQADPWLAGAYCDLANAYYNAGQIQLAVVLWEQARRLLPTYPSLQSVHTIQEQASIDFPEYF